jgi:hypothetical protein
LSQQPIQGVVYLWCGVADGQMQAEKLLDGHAHRMAPRAICPPLLNRNRSAILVVAVL